MITKEDLTASYQQLENDLEPLRKELAEAKAKFEALAKGKEKPYIEMLEKYYDEQLLDINGKSVKVGDVITSGKASFKVMRRGMQFVFGEMLFNPRVMCQKIQNDVVRHGKEKHIHPHELLEYAVS